MSLRKYKILKKNTQQDKYLDPFVVEVVYGFRV
jgi:hypothetical protein